MTFEEWWKEMKPAECDELKDEFVGCWEAATEAAAVIADAWDHDKRVAAAIRATEQGK